MRPAAAAIVIPLQLLRHAAVAAQTPAASAVLTEARYDGAIATSRILLERLLSEAA